MSSLQQLARAIRPVVACLLLALGLRTWLVMGLIEPVTVAGCSMAPTLEHGEALWIDRTAFQWRLPRRWEVIVARNPTDGTELCVKRIVGLPGETVSFRGGQLFIDGETVSQTPKQHPPKQPGAAQIPWQSRQWQLGPKEYFLLGDNSSVSLDSRRWGPVPAHLLLGKPLSVR